MQHYRQRSQPSSYEREYSWEQSTFRIRLLGGINLVLECNKFLMKCISALVVYSWFSSPKEEITCLLLPLDLLVIGLLAFEDHLKTTLLHELRETIGVILFLGSECIDDRIVSKSTDTD